MKQIFLLISLCSLIACSKKIVEPVPAERIDRLYTYLAGSYTNTEQVESSEAEEYLLHIAPIWQDLKGEHWLYVERRNVNSPNVPTQQQVIKLVESMDFLKQQVYFLPNAKDYIGAWKNTAVFDSITPSDVKKISGCTVFFKEAEKDNFKGITLGKNCGNRFKGAKYARTDMSVRPEHIRWLHQGFDENNQFIWGPKHGGIEFVQLEEKNMDKK